MLKIEDNILYLVKGDSANLKVDLKKYTYTEGDTLTLTVKKDLGILAYLSKTVPANEEIIITSDDTARMATGTYWYDVQLTLADGTIETVMPINRLVLVDEVTTDHDLIIHDPSATYVKSINGLYGEVTLSATDLGAVAADDLAEVAFSGDYNDLTNKPLIPEPYNLPIASQTELGGVKIDGTTIIINDGTISAMGGTGDIASNELRQITNFGWLYAGQLDGIIPSKACGTIQDADDGLKKGLILINSGNTSIEIPRTIWGQYYERYYRPTNGIFGNASTYGTLSLAPNIYIVPLGKTLLIGTRDDINLALRNSLRYDNSSSTLSATTIKEAIDELAANEINHITNTQLENILTNRNYVSETALMESLATKQDTLVSGSTIKTINGNSLLGSGNLILEGGQGGSANWGSIGGNITEQEDLANALNAKQNVLSSGVNIKTINGNSLLGEGNLIISGGSGSSEWGSIGGTITNQTDLMSELNKKVNTSAIKQVAITGDYNDLTNRPNIPTQYVLPIASATTLGGVKVGNGLTIVNGVLNATAAGYSAGEGIKIENNIISLDLAIADSEAY